MRLKKIKCIYLRTNFVNGKQYVGQTIDFERRETEWKKGKKYSGGIIDLARDKYGVDNFSVEILKECKNQDELNELEQHYIEKFKTKVPYGYNLTDGGGGQSGHHRSEETKKKISEALKGIKVSLGMTGHHHSEESKKKMSDTKKGKAQLQNRKKIYQYKNDILINIFDSVSEAVKNGFSWGGISSASNGHLNKEGNHTYKGYEWYQNPI